MTLGCSSNRHRPKKQYINPCKSGIYDFIGGIFGGIRT